jgi:hypothetical protein
MSTIDTTEIVNVINLYALAVDATRWDLFERIFTPDVEVNALPNGRWSDLPSLRQRWAEFHDPLDGSTHTFTNHHVIVSGRTAHALSYVMVRLMRQMAQGESFYECGGWYDDQLVRTADGWRIKARTYGSNWWRGNPAVGGNGFDPTLRPLKRAAAAGEITLLKAFEPA